jgi:hypothetical protein
VQQIDQGYFRHYKDLDNRRPESFLLSSILPDRLDRIFENSNDRTTLAIAIS